jgi:murein DD-endopeptidase MepM/ murein hydrolase activator NlpD
MSSRLRSITACGFGLLSSAAFAATGHHTDSELIRPPVTPACVSSPFGPRIMPNRPLAGTFHNGIDLPAPLGAPVNAVAPGTVIRVQQHGVGGLEMLIQHVGFIGVYSHLGTIAPAVAEGSRVVRSGEKIAVVGHTGLTYGPHLYFGMIVDGRPVDPVPYLDVTPCGAAASAASLDTRIRPTRRFADDGELANRRTRISSR